MAFAKSEIFEPFATLAELAAAIDQKRAGMSCGFASVTGMHDKGTVADRQLDGAGGGMHVTAGHVVAETFLGIMAGWRSAANGQYGFGTGPAGTHENESHVLEMPKGGQSGGGARDERGIVPKEVEKIGGFSGDVSIPERDREPLGVGVPEHGGATV